MPRNIRMHGSTRSGAAASALALLVLVTFSGVATAEPASAATNANVTIQTRYQDQGTNVYSFKLTYGAGAVWCYTLYPTNYGDGNAVAVTHGRTGIWFSRTIRLPVGNYKVQSFSADACDDGFGTAGSAGSIDMRVSSRWTLYPGRPPKVNN